MTPDSTRKTPTKADLIAQLERKVAELAREKATTAALLTLLGAVSHAADSVPISASSMSDWKVLSRANTMLACIKVLCAQDDPDFVFSTDAKDILRYARQVRDQANKPVDYEIYVSPPEDAEPVAVIPAPPAPAAAAGVIQPDSRPRIELLGGRTQTCDCPTDSNRVVRHQRGSCTDPLVARLDWYADSVTTFTPDVAGVVQSGGGGWISGGMGAEQDGRPDGSEYRTEPGCICDANYGECPIHVDVSKPIEGDPVPCTDPECGHIAADHAITDFSNLAARFPCTRCGCTNFTISSAKVRR